MLCALCEVQLKQVGVGRGAAESLRVWGQLARFVTSQRGGEQQITNGKKGSRNKN